MIMKKEYIYISDLSLVVRVCVYRSIFHTYLIFLYLNIPIEYSLILSKILSVAIKERNGEEERCLSVDRSINFVLNPRRDRWIYEYLI